MWIQAWYEPYQAYQNTCIESESYFFISVLLTSLIIASIPPILLGASFASAYTGYNFIQLIWFMAESLEI
jgi:hypothetical protein